MPEDLPEHPIGVQQAEVVAGVGHLGLEDGDAEGGDKEEAAPDGEEGGELEDALGLQPGEEGVAQEPADGLQDDGCEVDLSRDAPT